MRGAHFLRYTDDQIREAGRLLLQGLTYEQVAQQLGMHRQSVARMANGTGHRWRLLEEVGWDV